MSNERYYKEQIRNRMLKFAAAFWGIKKAENFDPIVKLLIESMANEMYMLGDDFSKIETRLLEKTARMLTPGILIAPSPAHAVIHATPIEVTYQLSKDAGTYYDSNNSEANNEISTISLYPSCNTLLHKGDVKYLLYDDLLYQVDRTLNKTMTARLNVRTEPYTVWLGLEMDEQIRNLKDLSFYLELPNVTDSYEYLYLLSCSEWFVQGRKISMRRGIYETEQTYANEAMSFFSNFELINVIDREITGLYKNNFLTIDEDISITEKGFLPNEFMEDIPETLLGKLKEPMIWIKIIFPSHFTSEILENLHIGINVVPVENKQLQECVMTIEDTFSVIPLMTGPNEYLLSVHSVKDIKGQLYHELSYNNREEEKQFGTYSIRKGGCERFDSRTAKELLEYLSNMLDDESNAFGTIQSMKLRAITQQMTLLLAQMREISDNIHEHRATPYYLMIDQAKEREQITVKYWVTNCEVANGLLAGMSLSPNKNTYLHPQELVLITSTYGGKQEPKNEDRINLYKYELTSRSRILTNDDIANFCRKELGELLKDIHIGNGVEISKFPNEGLVRTKDIRLQIEATRMEPVLEEQLKKDLKTKLIERSPDTFNYRIFIER